ncbi:MAG: hypothetical protein PHG06_00560 [Parabacteroides sp.]|nr:hypothetical protein [Parabacteroides sp.]
MTSVSLRNVSEIHTDQFWYDNVSNVEIVYLNGNQFLQFTHLSRFSNVREVVCISSDSVTKIDYYSTNPKLKTQAEVLQAYKDGRLVGY